jgi:hypothetical protein
MYKNMLVILFDVRWEKKTEKMTLTNNYKKKRKYTLGCLNKL